MKKLYLSFIALLCTLGTFAQSTVENINQPKAMKPIIIIRKTKCSTIVKRNDIFSKRNVYFSFLPPLCK